MKNEDNKNTNLNINSPIPTRKDWIRVLKKLSIEQKYALSQFLDAMITINEADKELTL